MRIILLGAPGSGKGTQAKKIARKYRVPHVSTGDILRAAVQEKTPAGLKAAAYMAAGELVPDEVTIKVLQDRLAKPDCRDGYLLDGFPRNLAQARILDATTKPIEIVLNLVVDENVLLPRIEGRRMCRKCGASYHVSYFPPQQDGICDLCGGELYQRDDDNAASVKKRMAAYHAQTVPLVAYYREKGVCRDVDATGGIDETFAKISSLLEEVK